MAVPAGLLALCASLASGAFLSGPLTGAATATTAVGPMPRLGFMGYLHADAVAWDESSTDELDPTTRQPLNGTRFLIRRAHARVEAFGAHSWGAAEVDANTVHGPAMRLIEANVSFHTGRAGTAPPLLEATLGLFKTPFGYDAQVLAPARTFFEATSFTRALFPGEYDLGVRLQGGYDVFRYQIALTNGDPSAEALLPVQDPNRAKDLLWHLGVELPLGEEVELTAGFSGLLGRGFTPGAAATKDMIVWRDLNQDGQVQVSELMAVSGQAATPSLSFDRSALGADLRLVATIPELGRLFAFAEFVWAKNLDRGLFVADPIGAGRDLRELGVAFGFTQELGEHALVGLRYDRYNPDADVNEVQGATRVAEDRSFSTIAALVSWRVEAGAALLVEYDHNGNALGRSASGAPQRLGNDTLILRGALAF